MEESGVEHQVQIDKTGQDRTGQERLEWEGGRWKVEGGKWKKGASRKEYLWMKSTTSTVLAS